jgi:hypothetical protein
MKKTAANLAGRMGTQNVAGTEILAAAGRQAMDAPDDRGIQ